MWAKPNQLATVGIARPLRVAYLIDIDECTDQLLDCIFSESYGRWGGRRTLIVPAKPDGIDTRYTDWLSHYDADVIYSFVALAAPTVARIHEKYGPAHLTYHAPIGRQPRDDRYFRIELPLPALRSLSVVPALLSRSWGFGGPVSDLRIIDKYFDKSESHFISENFGFLGDSYQSMTGQNFPQLFTTLTLISQESLDSAYLGKDPRARYVVGERTILEELGRPSQILSLATASDLFAPHLSTEYNDWSTGFTIVVGDTPNDRVLFWNQHHCQENPWVSTIAGLRVPLSRIDDQDFLAAVKEIVVRRGKPSSQGHPMMTLRSCSLPHSQLERLAERLRAERFWGAVRSVHHDDHAACVPSFAEMYSVDHRYNLSLPELRTQQTAEFQENRAYVPDTIPWHMREAPPPAGLREGYWMADLAIDRLNDHCRFSNVRDTWVLPRRLRLEKAFKVEWQDDHPQTYGQRVIRVTVRGALSLPMALGQRSLAITIPEDIDAFRTGLCTDREWLPFTHDSRALRGIPRYAYAEPSDKGRYLLAVLEHFETLPDAFAALMNGYWRGTLISLGAVPVEKNTGLRQELIRTLRKRLGRPSGGLVFSSEPELERLAREAIRFGRMAGKSDNLTSYSKLYKRWKAILDADLAADTHLSEADKEHYSNRNILDRSIQYLCRRQILFQGREWQCKRCFNRNWITVDDMRATLECQICKQRETAPVSGDWQFRANGFLVEAYREQGVEAVIWTLWRLWDTAQRSFYFAPSMWLWEAYPRTREDGPNIEIDALAVVDGQLYLCEAKSSSGLDNWQVEQLCSAVTRIHPDVLLIACMDEATQALRRTVEAMQERLGSETKVDLIEFKPESLEIDSMLPS
jgi:hypothetical protein